MPVGPGEFCTVPPAEAVLRGCVLYGLLLPHSVPSGYCISFVLFQIVLVVTQNYDLCTNRLDNSFFFQRFVWITLFDEITLGSEASTANCVLWYSKRTFQCVYKTGGGIYKRLQLAKPGSRLFPFPCAYEDLAKERIILILLLTLWFGHVTLSRLTVQVQLTPNGRMSPASAHLSSM